MLTRLRRADTVANTARQQQNPSFAMVNCDHRLPHRQPAIW
jgi:hypothetical protein